MNKKIIEQAYPLSPMQSGFLFHSLYDHTSDAYFVQIIFELQGNLSISILEDAWKVVSNHHPTLRTGFIWEKLDKPLQYVLESIEVPFQIEDWQDFSEEEQHSKLKIFLKKDREVRFNLAKAPLFRLFLIQLSSKQYYLIWSHHHILIDGWCWPIILNDVFKAYEELRLGKSPSFTLRRPYQDYISWLQEHDIDQAQNFWKNYLSDLEEPTRLSFQELIDKNREKDYDVFSLTFTTEETDAIKRFAQQNSLTVNTVIQGAVGIVLRTYTQKQDLVLGITISGRSIDLPGIEEMVGLFINTLPLKISFNTTDTTLSFLRRLQEQTQTLNDYAYTPLPQIQSWLGTNESLFDVLFVFENYPLDGVDTKISEFFIKSIQGIEKTEYPLTISISPGNHLYLSIGYQNKHFNEGLMKRLAQHLKRALNQISEHRNLPPHMISILTKEEVHHQLVTWNNTKTNYPKDKTIHQLFEEQVQKTPHKIAVIYQDQKLTYEQLNNSAHNLAQRLKKRGVGPNTLIALALERSLEMIIGLLGILKAGGAYLPLDPTYPQERLQFMLADAQIPLLLTQSSLKGLFENYPGVILALDQEEICLDQELKKNPLFLNNPFPLAYVIYTSGSTGKPKGVPISHKNVVNVLIDMRSRFEIQSSDCWVAVTTLSFDIAALEIYLPLITGAKVVLAEHDTTTDPFKLMQLMRKTSCSIMQATPATWKMLINAHWQRPPSLKVLCGGETLPVDLVNSLNKKGGTVWNLYGPTETTIWSTVAKLTGIHERIFLGRPIANTRVYILDANLQILPMGIPGEIYIAGDGLAQHYLNEPELTTQRFVNHTFLPGRHETLYRTGDIGRYVANGEIEFLGRIDHQIKLRGYRIELGEIENCLIKHDSVKEAAVIPYKGNGHDINLIAHVVPNENTKKEPIQFSLFYFASLPLKEQNNPYDLFLKSAKFADQAGFKAIWTPERHFHEVGGQYPNPSVLSAAAAIATKNIKIRAGSVVLPLHNPLRVAEEWSVVDHLSQGRVGISFASGWNPKDFVFFPENFSSRREIMLSHIEKVRSLWRGEKINGVDGHNNACQLEIFPKPKQPELPIWITTGGEKEAFREAGKIGANILTHLLGQSIEDLAEKIFLYRKTLEEHGYEAKNYIVTVMIHTFLSESTESALKVSYEPFCNYLKSHISLQNMAQSVGKSNIVGSERDQDDIIQSAFKRYTQTASLIGSVDDCLKTVENLKKQGVDEIACLIDFGINEAEILENLPYLVLLKEQSSRLIDINPHQLTLHLKKYLPDYMLPSGYVTHKKLPLTQNGKINKKELERQSQSALKSTAPTIPPQTELECLISKIWYDVLKVEIKSIYDNFFKLGGHSLLATQAISRIRQSCQVDLSLRALFENPTLDALCKCIEFLKTKKTFSTLPPLVGVERNQPFPLSFAQQRLWFLDQLIPHIALYNSPYAFRLEGDLNISALEKAFNNLLQRHESLRTIFPVKNGIAYQVIAPHFFIDFTKSLQNLTGLIEEERVSHVSKLTQEEARTSFNLSSGPLIRIKLAMLSKKKYVLLITLHHIISDGWSMEIFFRELSDLYNAFVDHKEPELSSLPLQYVDFTIWQRNWLQGKILEQQLSYWQKQLTGIPDLLELPADMPRPKELTYQGGIYCTRLPKEIKTQLNQLAQEHQATLFMTILAIFQALLFRYTGQKDIVVGSPIANRHHKETEEMIGFFVNTLALRTTFEGNETFIDLLSQVRETTLQAYQHQDVPFEQLVDHLNIYRELNRTPVFQVMFILQNTPHADPLTFKKIRSFPLSGTHSIAAFDLALHAYVSEEALEIEIEYATDLFNPSTIERMANHFKELIKGILKNPTQNIQTLPLLTKEEEHQILIEWNDVKTEYPKNKSIHHLFEDQVTKTPNNLAVIYKDQQITYQQLNERSNQLAHHLRANKVQPDTLVAVAVERSLEMIISLLGILKAGGAYVPLDQSCPEERLSFMLKDTQAPVLLTHSTLVDKFKTYQGTISTLDKLWPHLSKESPDNPQAQTSPHNLAYVMYTSGSTGRPKGVMINHRNIVNNVHSQIKYLKISSTDKIIQVASPSFDASIWEIFSALLTGSTLYIIDDSIRLLKNEFYDFITKNKINIITITPKLLELLPKSSFDTSCKIIVMGDTAREETLKYWSLKNLIIKGYGPTEATIGTSLGTYKPGDTINNIGTPLSNYKIYILDKSMNPVPVGISGEIYIGGVGLARAYLNRPDLTAAKFIPNPFISDQDSQEDHNLRLYQTGDFARYLPDGNIEFLGRIDDQVKIRGFRIELGEVESVLNAHGDVSQAVLLAKEDKSDILDKKLIAYVVLHPEKIHSLNIQSTLASSAGEFFSILGGEIISIVTEDLRNHLADFLPNYLIPSFFVYIDKVPLTSSGKIDRKALPDPDLSLRIVGDDYITPQSSLERELASIWKEILKVEKIGTLDSFFKLGGHSLLATQVISRIREIFNIDIPLRALFENPTVATLSQIIDALRVKNIPSSLPALLPMERKGIIPLSFAQQRLWFLDQLLPNIALYNIPVALKLKGLLDSIALEKAFNTLIERHESLRTIFPSAQGEAYQEILPQLEISLKKCSVDLTLLKKKQQKPYVISLARQEAMTPFNLSTDPLIRLKLLILSKKEYILLITLHHIISDGLSMGIFFKELSALYNAYSKGNDLSLPPLPIQYADFVLWQRNWLQGKVLKQQLSYWKEQLADIPDLLELPTDKARPKKLTYKGATYSISLSKEIKDQLNQLAQKNKTSLFMTLLAIFQVLLYRYTSQKNIVVGSPLANRQYKETEGLIGFFVNTLAFKTTFEGDETFLSVLNKVKETTLRAYQHQDIPFEQLVDHLNISRSLNRNPLVQVWFTLESDEKDLTPLFCHHQVETLELANIYTNFDLKLHAQEHNHSISFSFSYMTDLFEEETIKRIASYLHLLITDVLNDPFKKLSDLDNDQRWYQQSFSEQQKNIHSPIKAEKLFHEIFQEQAEKFPYRKAIIFGRQFLTYKDLNEKANQLAHSLIKKNVGPDTLVAIALDRSLDMIVGFLGVLKAGGAYLPLDPSYPNKRLDFILKNSSVSILITTSNLKGKFNHHNNRIIILLDQEKNLMAQEQSCNLNPRSAEHNLAYVIYTSGSMGQPKGVMITHKNIVHYTKNILDNFENDLILKFAHISTFSADLGNTVIYPALFSGGELHILESNNSLDPNLFFKYIHKHQIDCLKIVPSHFDSLLMGSKEEKLKCFPKKYLILGGELLKNELLDRLKKESDPSLQIFNHYGPTETTVGCCIYSIPEHEKHYTSSVPIGKPFSNVQIYILDQYLCPSPLTVKGEIYVAGIGVGRGYLNDPKLTAKSFIPNPFITEIEAKNGKNLHLYRTGDFGKYHRDGNIEFLGRVDSQTKIRGFRIELGEIESTLKNHGDVKKALVTLDGNRLIGYIIPNEFTPTEKELIDFLSINLPGYMIPSSFVFIEKIPLTPNGKIDYKALAITTLPSTEENEEFNAPQNNTEHVICSIFSKLLNLKEIDRKSNFFKMGGDSILSIQLISKARQHSLNFTVQDVFSHPTPAGLAIIVEKSKNKTESQVFPQQSPTIGDVPLTPIQLLFFERKLINQNQYNQSMLLEIKFPLNFELLKETFSTLLSHHDSLRFRYKLRSKWSQTCLDPSDISISDLCSYVDLSNSFDETLSSYVSLAQKTLNIETGPLLKVILFENCKQKSQRLFIILHHLIVDGISWRILLEDVETIYMQLLNGKTPSLPLKTNSYQQWALCLKNYAKTKTLLQEFSYWREAIQDINVLPTDFDLEFLKAEHTLSIEISLTKEETTILLKEVPQKYHTQINDILLTALVLAIGDWTNSFDLSLCLEGHGRENIHEKIDLSRTIGWFTSMFPVSLKIKDPSNLEEAINTVKDKLQNIPHKGIGYGILSYLTNKNLISHLKPSLRFNYLGQWDDLLHPEKLFTFSEKFYESSVFNGNQSAYILDINAEVRNGCLHLNWSYSSRYYKKSTIKKLTQAYVKHLRHILASCKKNKPLIHKPLIYLLSNRSESPIIFFIHPIGGKVFWYQDLCESLSPSFQCYGIESIFLNKKHGEIDTLKDLAALYAQEILTIQPSGHFILCGWSFGGILAYEIAHFLISLGHEVKGIIIIDQDSEIDHCRIQKEIFDMEKNYNEILNSDKKEDLICKYRHYKCLHKYQISSKITKIVFFESEELSKKRTSNWGKYCKDFNSHVIIGKDHFSILEKDDLSFMTDKIKLALLEKL